MQSQLQQLQVSLLYLEFITDTSTTQHSLSYANAESLTLHGLLYIVATGGTGWYGGTESAATPREGC